MSLGTKNHDILTKFFVFKDLEPIRHGLPAGVGSYSYSEHLKIDILRMKDIANNPGKHVIKTAGDWVEYEESIP